MKKILLIILIAFTASLHLNANHLIGGELSYRCEGGSTYKISLSLYRDCNCTNCAEFDNSAILTIFDGNNTFVRTEELILLGTKNILPNISSLCIDETSEFCVESSIGYEYIVNLPPTGSGYKIVYQRCCRNNTITNIIDPGDTGSTYEVVIPPSSSAECNNSAVFNNFPPIAICAGYPFEFDHSATDADGDSLVYELCTPFSGANPQDPQPVTASSPPYDPVVWEDGFSAGNPLVSNPQITLNTSTGQLSGLPVAIGQFVVAVCVKEFRNGILLNTSTRDFQFNVIDCTLAFLSSNCSLPNKIQTEIFYDLNQNKIKEQGEIWVNSLTLQIEPFGILGFPNEQNQGIFFVPPGAYTLSYSLVENPNWLLTSDTSSYSFNLDTINESKIIQFGVYPKEPVSDVQSFIAMPWTRCNDTIQVDIVAKNIGTTIADGTLWFENDNSTVPLFIDEPDTAILPNTFGWFFTDLYPTYNLTKQLNLIIPGPILVELADTSFFQLEDSLRFKSSVDYTDVNGVNNSGNFDYKEIRCSFDPNDKLVHPSRVGDYTLFEEEITYTIRFQNTGNDEAYHIVIKDTIDRNLDMASINLIGSSHLEQLDTKISDGRVFTFIFSDINLPDSTSNPKGSQGYVSYSIKPKTGLAENTVIKNSAAIFFDFNPHIQTNTVKSKMVSEIPIVSVNPDIAIPTIAVWPNPTTGLVKIDGVKKGSYTIFNVFGQQVDSGILQSNTTIDIYAEPKGVYFILVENKGNSIVGRIVKI